MQFRRRFVVALAFGLAGFMGEPAEAAHAAVEVGRDLYGKGDARGAFLQWELAAEEGDPLARFLLANLYLSGEGLSAADPGKAARLYEAAAEDGLDEAMLSLSSLYRTGHGVERDMHAAVKWLYAAAERGHPIAMFDLGEIFSSDEPDVAASLSHAFEWYRLAARQGLVIAQVKVGQMLIDGIGTEQDEFKGMVWLTIARVQAEAPPKEELPMSRRAFALDAVVAGDDEGRTLRELTIAIYDQFARSLPARIADEAERELDRLDPATY